MFFFLFFLFFFVKQKTAYEIRLSLVGSEMCIRDRCVRLMIIGIDDTDSRDGMCTTYLLAVLIGKLNAFGHLKDYPLLVRLNPNLKYKTRGNAALAMDIELNDRNASQKVRDLVIDIVERMAVLSEEDTNPGIVFIENSTDSMKNDLSKFSMGAVRDVLEIHEAKEILSRHDISHKGFKNERGLIGALAAAGFASVSYTHLRAHETKANLVCRLL